MKKAQGIPINVLIIALVALIVLIIVLAIFSGKIFGVSLGLQSCINKGGQCYDECPPGTTRVYAVSDCEDNQKCCMTVLNRS